MEAVLSLIGRSIENVSNAIKFAKAGGTVTRKVWCRIENGSVFQMIDTDIGIALEDKYISRMRKTPVIGTTESGDPPPLNICLGPNVPVRHGCPLGPEFGG